MYAPLVSPYSTHILAGKTEEPYALCRQETVFSETLSTQQALEERTSVAGCVIGRIPHFYKPPSVDILPSFVLEGRNHYGNVQTKENVRVNNGCCFIKGFGWGSSLEAMTL